MHRHRALLDEVVVSCCAGGASSTGAVVEKTVVLPQLHLLRNLLRSAHKLRWGFFRALYTGTGPGAVSTGTRPPSSHPSAPPPHTHTLNTHTRTTNLNTHAHHTHITRHDTNATPITQTPTHTTPHTTLTHHGQPTIILQVSFPMRRENLLFSFFFLHTYCCVVQGLQEVTFAVEFCWV